MKKFSLIIPCFNEEGNIDRLLNSCENFLKKEENELILVDNGSIDKTSEKIDNYLNINNLKKVSIIKNRGFGYGVMKGLEKANGEYLCYTHADAETDPNDVNIGIEIIKKNESNTNKLYIKGNRINRRKNNWSYLEMLISSGSSVFFSVVFRMKLKDLHAQPVIFHKDFFLLWKNAPNDFMLDIYNFILAKKIGLKIIRFPVNFNKKNRIYGSGNNDSLSKIFIGSLKHILSTFYLYKSILKDINEN